MFGAMIKLIVFRTTRREPALAHAVQLPLWFGEALLRRRSSARVPNRPLRPGAPFGANLGRPGGGSDAAVDAGHDRPRCGGHLETGTIFIVEYPLVPALAPRPCEFLAERSVTPGFRRPGFI